MSTWKDKLNGSYSVLDIKDCFEFIIKKLDRVMDNPPITVFVNKLENRIIFKIKTGYYFKLLTPEMIKLLWSSKNKEKNKDKSRENVPSLEINEVVLTHCSIVNK